MTKRRSGTPFLVVIQTHPIQYYVPVFRELAKAGVAMEVIFLTDSGARAYHDPGFDRVVTWDVPLLDGYRNVVLRPGVQLSKLGVLGRFDWRLSGLLGKLKPTHVLIHGYASLMNWVALAWAKLHGARILYFSDSNAAIEQKKFWWLAKRLAVGCFFKNVDCFLSPSTANEQYLASYGAARGRIRRIPFAIDVERFGAAASTVSEKRYDFIWAGKMTAEKRPSDFLRSLASASLVSGRPLRACMVGSGPQKDVCKRLAGELGISDMVDFTGFVNQADIPATLLSANTFVFTSEREAYGLAATEAVVCGLPLIVADQIGCVNDWGPARPDENALTYRAGDVEALASCMRRFAEEPGLLAKMSARSLEIAETQHPALAAEVIQSAMHGG